MTHFKGLYTALITPFVDRALDLESLKNILQMQVAANVDGVVVLGTTGESATLSDSEKEEIIKTSVDELKDSTQLIVGVGSNSTSETIANAKKAEALGADAIMVVCPYYNKPSQEGLFRHFKRVSDAVGIPIMIYNVPGRTVTNISDETIAELTRLPNISALKDATGDLSRPLNLIKLLGSRATEFAQLSGDDITAIAFNAVGGMGCISVTSNIFPELCKQIQNLTLEGKYQEAQKMHQKLVPIHQILFCETNPSPVKYAACEMGLIKSDEVRAPLAEVSENSRKKISEILKKLDVEVN